MKVLFLDFDGVLNSKQHYMATKDVNVKGVEDPAFADLLWMKHNVNHNNMWVLDYILKQLPDLKIVISSAWGAHYDVEQFKQLFRAFKLDDSRIIGITPRRMSSSRDHEVHWWLEANPDTTEWITVDDHIIFTFEDPDKKNEYTTDSWIGLVMPDAFKIIKHFNPNYKAPELFV